MTGTRLVFAAISTLYLLVAIPFEERDHCASRSAPRTTLQEDVRWKVVPYVH